MTVNLTTGLLLYGFFALCFMGVVIKEWIAEFVVYFEHGPEFKEGWKYSLFLAFLFSIFWFVSVLVVIIKPMFKAKFWFKRIEWRRK